MPREDSTHREALHRNRYTPAARSKGPTAIDNKRVVCPRCEKTFSRKTDLGRHMVLHDPNATKPHKCTVVGCSYASHQKSNLLVHIKRHANTRDRYCTWPLPDGVCPFRCTDPSSLNRHVKKHVIQALKRDEPIPGEFLKYKLRLVAKLGADPEVSKTSETAEDSRASKSAEGSRASKSAEGSRASKSAEGSRASRSAEDSRASKSVKTRIFDSASSDASTSLRIPEASFNFDFDSDPDLRLPQVNYPSDPATKVANSVNHGMSLSTSIPGPSSAGRCYPAEQPRMQPQNPGQRHYYGDPLWDCLPEEYLVNWPPPGQPRHQPRYQPPSGPPVGLDPSDSSTPGPSHAHAQQLQTDFASRPRPRSIEEIEGIAFRDLERNGVLPQTFFQPRGVQRSAQSTPTSEFCLFPSAENSFWL